MGKKSKRAAAGSASVAVVEGDVPVVGMREPCPCGSGRRYKACHGRDTARGVQPNPRPFEGFISECDLVALRELVPSATAPLTLSKKYASDRAVTLATVLPMAWPALVRADASILIGLQVTTGSGDASRDYADALVNALAAEPGEPVGMGRVTEETPRLQDVLDPSVKLEVTVHESFDFWIDGSPDDMSPDVRASLERAREYANPTARLNGVEAAYWTQMGSKEHLRWIMPTQENDLLNALARLHAAGADDLGPDTRYVGMFRACGVVAPVWDLPLGMGAEATEEPAAAFGVRLAEALADTSPLTDEQRRARAGLTNRQVTLR
jgi:hypothetical protein